MQRCACACVLSVCLANFIYLLINLFFDPVLNYNAFWVYFSPRPSAKWLKRFAVSKYCFTCFRPLLLCKKKKKNSSSSFNFFSFESYTISVQNLNKQTSIDLTINGGFQFSWSTITFITVKFDVIIESNSESYNRYWYFFFEIM